LGVVRGCVNWPRRFDHMQQHTGQHLLSAMFQERFGLPTVSFHLGVEICSIDLRGEEPTHERLLGAQRAANQAIFEDRPVAVRYGTREQLERLGVRKRVEREGLLRAIEIESADLQPCGGTHVRSTGQIGLILVRGCSKVRQDWRVEFACGTRAERLASDDFARERAVAEGLGCAVSELEESVDRLMAEREAHFKSLKAALQQLAEAKAAQMVSGAAVLEDGTRVVEAVLSDRADRGATGVRGGRAASVCEAPGCGEGSVGAVEDRVGGAPWKGRRQSRFCAGEVGGCCGVGIRDRAGPEIARNLN